jgi:hypothetical protein
MNDEQRVKGQVERAAATGGFAGGGTLFTEPVLVDIRRRRSSS